MPIKRLDEDLLWTIFEINVQHFPCDQWTSPLKTLRSCSQVSQSWRSSILKSSSLWRKVVEIDFLDQRNDDWRNEVMRRTGDGRLWVQGQASLPYFSLPFINQYWPRIEKLSINIEDELIWNGDQDLAVLHRPAPYLKHFSIGFRYLGSGSRSISLSPLFDNNAPNLEIFDAPQIKITPQASWRANIRATTFHGVDFSISQTLEALQGMQMLESVVFMCQPNDIDIPTYLARAYLPRLTRVQINGSPWASLVLLEHITPASGCLLFFDSSAGPVLGDHSLIYHTLPRYSRNFLLHQRTTRVSILCVGEDFTFVAYLSREEPSFEINLSGCTELRKGMLSALSLEPSYFSNITTLGFLFADCEPELNTIFKSMAASAFPAVTTISTDDTGIEILCPSGEHFPCPQLHTIELIRLTDPDITDDPRLRQIMLAFLNQRSIFGRPVSVLDITQFGEMEVHYDMGFLEEIQGLVVRWCYSWEGGINEYKCGNGQPELLSSKRIYLPVSPVEVDSEILATPG